MAKMAANMKKKRYITFPVRSYYPWDKPPLFVDRLILAITLRLSAIIYYQNRIYMDTLVNYLQEIQYGCQNISPNSPGVNRARILTYSMEIDKLI